MNRTPIYFLGAAALAVTGYVAVEYGLAQGRNMQPAPIELAIKNSFGVPAADAKTEAIVAAADVFLATLSDSQRGAAVYGVRP